MIAPAVERKDLDDVGIRNHLDIITCSLKSPLHDEEKEDGANVAVATSTTKPVKKKGDQEGDEEKEAYKAV